MASGFLRRRLDASRTFVTVIAPQILFRALPDQVFDFVTDFLGALFGTANDWLCWRLQVEMVTRASWQSLGPDHDCCGTALGQACRQGHRVGGLAEEIQPAAFTDLRSLVGQHADGLATP